MGLIIQLTKQNGFHQEGAGVWSPTPTKTGVAPIEPDAFALLPAGDDDTESYTDAHKRILLRYDAMERFGRRVVNRQIPSLIISGPPGLGKTYTLDGLIKESGRMRHDGLMPLDNAENWYDHVHGGISAPGLYHVLWNMRNGGIVLIDDSDGVYDDLESINMIKSATDSSKKRFLSWRKKSAWLGMHGIEPSFEFSGHVMFITNRDFERELEKRNAYTEHYKALMDRARYICLTLRTQRDFMIRIRQVCIDMGMLQQSHHLSNAQAEYLFAFVNHNRHRFYNLSLRLMGQLAEDMKHDPRGWEVDAEATKMKTTK